MRLAFEPGRAANVHRSVEIEVIDIVVKIAHQQSGHRLIADAQHLGARADWSYVLVAPPDFVIETQAGDISAYIPTNVISITDGQIFLEADLFNSGFRPAINVGNSVSRVGGSAQIKAMKQVAGTLRLDLAQFRELQAFAQFGSDLDKATQAQLARGQRLTEILKQPQYQPMDVEKQVLVIWAATNGFTDDIALEDIKRFEASLLKFVENSHPGLLADIAEKKSLTDEIKAGLKQVLEDFKDTWSKTSTDTDFATTSARATAAAQPTA